jgi:hypothetical protein
MLQVRTLFAVLLFVMLSVTTAQVRGGRQNSATLNANPLEGTSDVNKVQGRFLKHKKDKEDKEEDKEDKEDKEEDKEDNEDEDEDDDDEEDDDDDEEDMGS